MLKKYFLVYKAKVKDLGYRLSAAEWRLDYQLLPTTQDPTPPELTAF